MPTLNTYAAAQIAATAASAPPLVGPPPFQQPPAVAVAPNLSAATAIDIGTTLPYTTQQNVNFGGTTQTVWYKYTAQAGDVELHVLGFGDLTTYKPAIRVFSPTSTQVYLNLAVVTANIAVQFPLVVGDTYWFRFTSSTGNVATALLTVSVRRQIQNSAPVGSILILDDNPNFAASLLSAIDGTVLRFRFPFAGSENGDVLNTGELCLQDGNNSSRPSFYDKNLNLVLDSTINFKGRISTNKTSVFYLGDSGAGPVNATVTTATALGIQGATTWTLPATGLSGMAPSPDETILYYNRGTLAGPVKRWDLVNNVALSDLAAGIAGFSPSDVVALSDGTILVNYGGATFIVKHYSTTGTVLNTYTLPLDALGAPRICRAIDDPNSFWSFSNIAGGLAQFQNVKVSDGTILTSFSLVAYESGRYQGAAAATPANYFGPSQSCPIIIIRNALTNPPCPSIT